MNRSELIEESKGIVSNVYDNIGKIEEIEKLQNAVQEGQVSILMPDGKLVDLNVLSEEQFAAIKQQISSCLENNMSDASSYLEKIIKSQRKPAFINQDFEDAVKEMVASNKKPEPTVLNVNEVREYYKDHTQVECCKFFHVSTVKMGAFIRDNNITKPKQEPAKQLLDKEVIRKRYITNNEDLSDIAKDLGYTKQELFDFCQDNCIHRSKTPRGDWRG